jgi:hypothetical protein
MTPPADGTSVTLQNVVVVGSVESKKYGQLWVQDAGGGPMTGIHIFCNYGGNTPNCTLTEAMFQAFTPGQVISLTGSFKSYTPSNAPAAAKQLEIDAPTITMTTQMVTPVAITVTAADIAKDQSPDQYKGTYVKVTGPFTVTNVTPLEFERACTTTAGDAGAATTHGGFEATDSAQHVLAVALSFYKTTTYCMSDICDPMYPCNNPISNQTFASITGVVEPDFNSGTNAAFLHIAPVTDADLAH